VTGVVSLERKTGFEPATLTLARWCLRPSKFARSSEAGIRPPSFQYVHRIRFRSRALDYEFRACPSVHRLGGG
jgi:hypothetical protein